MKSSAIVCAIAAASLSLGSIPAFGQGAVRDRNASNNPEIYRQTHPEDPRGATRLQEGPNRNLDRRDFERREFERRASERRRDDRREALRREAERRELARRDFSRRDVYREENRYYYGARGPEFRRGGYIPREYRSRQYYVDDWRGHRLAPPPYGHQWVQVGSDYVLIAVATGLIATLILSQ